MVRAAVLIGVSQTGNLETLQAVHDGVRAVEKWALAQGLDREMVKVFTDERDSVEVSAVKKAVKELVDLTTVEQLLVYFAGHGVNLSLGEYWLLSGAPEDSNAAVNVAGSVELARYCGIPHVVLISDACRTAAEGIQAQAVRGSEIFPNISEGGIEKPVDVFFACALGAPSMEVKDPKKAASRYRAVYTDSLVEALQGVKDVVVKDPDDGTELKLIEAAKDDNTKGLIRPWPLSFYLQADVTRRLVKAKVKPGVSQTPVARINSRGSWLAEVPLRGSATARGASTSRGALAEPDRAFSMEPPAESPEVPETLFSVSRSMLRSALGQSRAPASERGAVAGEEAEGASELQASLSRIFQPFGSNQLESACGFKVRGTQFASVFSARAEVSIPDPQRSTLSVGPGAGPAANVLIEFDGGTGMVLPAIPQYIGSITVEDGEVVNVTYEPARNSPAWDKVKDRVDELRSLRALLASSARLGVFGLREAEAGRLAERIRVGTGLDPTMALYAAYAYSERQETDRIREISRLLDGDLSLKLFDLAMLAGELRGRTAADVPDLYPVAPLLALGWALMSAHRISLPPGIERLGDHRVESLWTLFDKQGVELIRSAIESKEID